VSADARPNHKHDFHALLHRFEDRLPGFCARASRRLRQPGSWMVRYPVAIFLILGGVFSFLPILGLWMLPLGLLLIAVDWPPLRPPLARMLHWIEQKWPPKKAEN
jgi:hypothetical protein